MKIKEFVQGNWDLIERVYPDLVRGYKLPIDNRIAVSVLSSIQKRVAQEIPQDPLLEGIDSKRFYSFPLRNRLAIIEGRLKFEAAAKDMAEFLTPLDEK